jgi:ABC-type sugar transport system substrate-binding protein
MRLATLALCAFVASAAGATEIPLRTFYSGNDVYGFCQHDRAVAFAYVAGLYDEAAHAAFAIDSMRGLGKSGDAGVDFALRRVVGYCKPEHATLEQVTDVFCKYLREFPEKRDGFPPILFSEALTKAWPCPG